ncbi:MAG TPA: glutamate racemase [Nitrosomonas europaea]|nr:glutamate racemase [Nitrosomonas europaea]
MQSGFVGIFDSGVGGLAVYRAARKLLPHQAFVYVADSGFAPYGSRESAYITRRVTGIADALVNNGAKALVVACNTATVTTVTALRAKYSLPIIGIEPAIKPAAAISRNSRIVVLTTRRTAESEAVAQLCVRYGTHVQIMLQPCPGLADQVEAGNIDGEEVKEMLRQYLAPAVSLANDVVVLGCTHFTFLADQIQNLAGPQVTIIEPSEAVARQLAHRLSSSKMTSVNQAQAAEAFYTTAASPSAVGDIMSKLLGRRIEVLAANGLGLASIA